MATQILSILRGGVAPGFFQSSEGGIQISARKMKKPTPSIVVISEQSLGQHESSNKSGDMEPQM